MSVISVAETDAGGPGARWEVPPDPALINSPIPRGTRVYGETVAVPALGANDETSVIITLTFPTQFNYLIKNLTIDFKSDDLTSEFSNFGSMEYLPAGQQAGGTRRDYALVCEGATFRAAAQSEQIYHPVGLWRQWITGSLGDLLLLRLVDISGDTSTAGDVSWIAEFWEYDIEQCFKWPVNTPIPNIPY